MKKITKLMLTLMLLAMGATGASADEWVQDYSIDYSTKTNFPFYVMGYVPEWVEGVMTDYGAMFGYIKTTELDGTETVVGTTMAGNDEYSKVQLSEAKWHQYFIADGIPTTVGGTYTVKAMVKASEAVNIDINMGWGWGEGQSKNAKVAIGTEWTEVEWEYSKVGSTSCNLVAQPGNSTATIEWKYVTVGHFTNTELQDRPEPTEPAAPQWSTSIKVIDYSTQTAYPYWWMGDRINDEPDQPNFCGGTATLKIDNGALLIDNSVVQTNFWDLQPFIIDNVTMQEGYDYVVRIKMNTTGAGSARVVLGTWSKDYYKDFNFADDYAYYDIELGKATFSADNNAHALMQCGNFVGKIAIAKVEVFEVLPKQELSDAIALAKKYNGTVYTAASFAELTSKIAAAETALAEATDLASVQAATESLTTAISGLQLAVGYSTLTADMFKRHESLENPGEGTGTGCAYSVGESTGQPYGDGSVNYLNWADISAYKKLVILVADGTPRIMMNRQAPVEGGDANGGAYVELTDAAVNGVVEVDLTQYEYAHLNAIKGAHWQNVTVLGMYLYREMSYAIVGDLTGGFPVEGGDDVDVVMTPTETEGEYTLTVQNFVVANEDTYKYKLRANGNWNDYQLPAGSDNATWTPEDGIGIYTLTFTANVLNHALNCVGEKTADFEYAVVGCTYEGNNEVQSELFAGSKAWDTNTTDIMTKQNDGTYVWEKEGVVLPAKWIDLKVVARDGENVINWYGNENGANVGLNINETGGGIYNVTVTFNGSNVTATAERVPTATIYFVNDSDWPAENIKVWVWDAKNNNYNYTGGDWNNQPTMTPTGEQIDGKDVYSWSTYELNPTPTNVIISNNGSETERTGDQPFVDGATYRPNGISTVTKTISEAGYATFYCASALDFSNSGLTAYVATLADGKVSFSPVTSVPANTGVLLKGEAGDYTINTTTSADQVSSAMLGVLEDTKIDAPIYVLMNGDNGVGFYQTTVTFTVGANTAYLPATAGARSFIAIDMDNTVTAIEGINAEKALNGEVYNLQGQRVMKAQKGLYIVDGKKIVVK